MMLSKLIFTDANWFPSAETNDKPCSKCSINSVRPHSCQYYVGGCGFWAYNDVSNGQYLFLSFSQYSLLLDVSLFEIEADASIKNIDTKWNKILKIECQNHPSNGLISIVVFERVTASPINMGVMKKPKSLNRLSRFS